MRHLPSILAAIAALVGLPLAAARAEAAPNARCPMPAGWSEVTRAHPRFVVFGEVHGTREGPAFVGDVACALAAKGERVLVAVEHGAVNDAAFQAAWRLPHPTFEAAITKVGWAGRRDGVASEAMLRLLVRLHALKAAGRAIDIVAFNGTRDAEQRRRFAGLPGQGPHEAAQAENIRLAADARPYDHVLVLVGNLHARKQPVGTGEDAFRPMAMQLAPPGRIVSLDMLTASGTMWNCIVRADVRVDDAKPIPEDAIDCGDHPHEGRADLRRRPFMALGTPPDAGAEHDYDGFFWVGRVSGSGPAVTGR